MSAKKTYTAAIVGAGRIGCFLDNDPKRKGVIWTHAGAYNASARTNLVGVVDSDEKARMMASDRWAVPAYPTLESLLKVQKIDILSICTPSSSHAALFKKAVSAKIPAIWCEKPMTTKVSDADMMVRLSKKTVVSVNHTRRWDKAYETARRCIRQGHLGRLLNATAWYTNGVANIGSHLFDTLRFLLGDAKKVWAAGGAQGADPTLSGVIHFSSGVICQIVGCEPGHTFVFEIDILGTDGRLRISQDGTLVELSNAEPSRRYTGFREFSKPKVLWKGQDGRRLVTAVEEIVHCLDKRTSTRGTAEDGMKSVELISAFILSSKTSRYVTLPLGAKERKASIPVR